jgi:glycosyltransferase involved in cell wall biosynthesis
LKALYIAKVPPSQSGVARYAGRFRSVLRSIADVRTVITGHEARESTRLSRILEIVTSVRRELRHKPDVVVAELSGRAIGELLACAYVLCRRRRPLVWLTVHDSPCVTGGLFWLELLDRKGLRRVASLLSNTVGRAIERWTLVHADVVVCLSGEGSVALAEHFSLKRSVVSMHPVAEPSDAGRDRHQVFVPGPVELSAAAEVLDAIADIPTTVSVAIGFTDRATEAGLRVRAGELGIAGRVRFAGYVSQEELTALYEESLVVVYWRPQLGNVANRAACSYPVVDALASGCALVTNAARGAREYVVDSGAGFDLAGTPDRLRDVLAELLTSPTDTAALGQRATDFAASTFSATSVATEVAVILSSLRRPSPPPGH